MSVYVCVSRRLRRHGSSEQSGTFSVRSRGRDTIGMCGGQMTSRSEQKLTSEMMKRSQQRRRTVRHESQHQLK